MTNTKSKKILNIINIKLNSVTSSHYNNKTEDEKRNKIN